MTSAEIKRIAEGLSDLEREWLTGWKGPAGAAFNAIAEHLQGQGLLISSMNWNLNEHGLAVRDYLEKSDD